MLSIGPRRSGGSDARLTGTGAGWLIGLALRLALGQGDQRRRGRIVADRRPVLLHPVLILPPSHRPARIIRAVRQSMGTTAREQLQLASTFPRRPARIIRRVQ